MSVTAAVLFVGEPDEALTFGSALSTVASFDTTVISTSDRIEAVPNEDRLDCLVYADETVPVDIDPTDLPFPVVGYGTGLHGATTATIDRDADIDVLAAAVADVVTDETGADSEDGVAVNTLYRGPDIYYAVDEDWRITDWDPRMKERTGITPSDALGERLRDVFPETIDAEITGMYNEVMASREPATFELYYDPLDYWAEVRAYPTDDGGIEFFTRDITDRKERQQELAETRTRIERTLERIEDGFFAVDDGWAITYVNDSAERILDIEADDAIGESLWDLFPDAVDTRIYEEYREAMAQQESTTFTEYYEPLAAWFEVRAYPSDDGLSIYFRDVTGRRERQQELRRATRAIEEAPVGITITDPEEEGNPMIYVNDAFCELTGYDRESVIGRNYQFLQYEDTDPETAAEMRRAIDDGKAVSVEILNRRVDGTPFWNRIDVAPVRDDDGDVVNFVSFQRDVTDTQQLEQRLRALHETTQELMVAGSDEEIGTLAVEAASEILDLSLTTLWRYNEADESFIAVARTDDAASTFDRQRLPVEADDDETLSARETPGWDAFQSGEILVYDDLRAAADGEPSVPVESSIVAPLGEYGVLATADTEPNEFDDRDVDLFRILATSTKAALLQAERELELQRQNERLDEFVSVVSHDLRNPLQVAISRLEAYQQTGDDVHLGHIERGHDRMQRLIDDMLVLARQGETVDEPEQVQLSTIARDAWEIVANLEASLEVTTGTTLVADPDRLRRLLENLFRNAVEHAGKDVSVEVGTTHSGFYVADDGPGIEPEDRDDAFEYGVTTSEDGTGFGLAIVKRIVDAHGWTIDIEDSELGGARFEIASITTLAKNA